MKSPKDILPSKFLSAFCLIFITGTIVVLVLSSFINHTNTIVQEEWKAPAWADTLRNPYPDEPLFIVQGEELYDTYCWTCHGETGYGDGAAGGAGVEPANFHDENVKKQSDGALFWKLSTGRGNMPPFQDVFSEQQRWQLVAYIRKLSNQD